MKGLKGFCYPLRLLGTMKIPSRGKVNLGRERIHDEIAFQRAEALRKRLSTPQSPLLCTIMVYNIEILARHSSKGWYDYFNKLGEAGNFIIWAGTLLKVLFSVIGLYEGTAVENSLAGEVAIFRNLLANGLVRENSNLWLLAKRLLLLDIEVRSPGVHREIGLDWF